MGSGHATYDAGLIWGYIIAGGLFLWFGGMLVMWFFDLITLQNPIEKLKYIDTGLRVVDHPAGSDPMSSIRFAEEIDEPRVRRMPTGIRKPPQKKKPSKVSVEIEIPEEPSYCPGWDDEDRPEDTYISPEKIFLPKRKTTRKNKPRVKTLAQKKRKGQKSPIEDDCLLALQSLGGGSRASVRKFLREHPCSTVEQFIQKFFSRKP